MAEIKDNPYRGKQAGNIHYDNLKAKCDKYFDDCANHLPKPRKPTRPGLCLALGVTVEQLAMMEAGKVAYGQFVKKAIEEALLRIRDDLEQRIDNMAIFSLKQAHYGGYSDKQTETGGGLTIQVQVTGVDGKTAQELGK